MTSSGLGNKSNLIILHIANDYSWTKVHSNLYAELDRFGCVQKIFVPLRNSVHKGSNSFPFKTVGSELVYSNILNTRHRLLFRSKVKFLFNNIQNHVELGKIAIVHATTLFSDGAVALKIWQLYGVPYVVSIRNTDIYTFLKYRPDLVFLVHQILKNAKRIIVLSDAYKDALAQHLLIKCRFELYEKKIDIIYNGIDKYWHDNLNFHAKKDDTRRVLFVGRFDRNKNILNLISSMIKLRSDFSDLELGIVGGGGDCSEEVLDLIKRLDWVKYYGPVLEKDVLKQIYQYHDVLAVPSIHETFGLVYIEALSQGLPILCSIGQGIDGVFDFKVGEFVNPLSIQDISCGVKKLLLKRDKYDLSKIDFSQFSWPQIAKKYLVIYNDNRKC